MAAASLNPLIPSTASATSGTTSLQRDISLRSLRRPNSRGILNDMTHSVSHSRPGSRPSTPTSSASTSALGQGHQARAQERWRRTLKGKERDSDPDEATGGESGRLLIRGQGEAEGEFDAGWKGDEEESAALLPALTPASKSSPRAPDKKAPVGKSRTVAFRTSDKARSIYPPNIVRNQKYNLITFLPLVLYEQFKFFFNLYFLLVALSQFVPALRIGFLATYIVPLSFVLLVTIGKEGYDDYKRYQRDVIANATRYAILDPNALAYTAHSPLVNSYSHHPSTSTPPLSASLSGTSTAPVTPAPLRSITSAKLRVGDLVQIEKNQRVPADVLLLRTSDVSGTCFVRTDQLDGETDWKLRVAVERTQRLAGGDGDLLAVEGEVSAAPPSKDIHEFLGALTVRSVPSVRGEDLPTPGPDPPSLAPTVVPLTAENMLWANTVLAAGSAVGFVVYTGRETRAVMNTSHPETKVGLLDLEINRLAKILCAVTLTLSITLVALNGFRGWWYIYVFRFLILFSSIIPISLRVNLDMGKTVYAHQIMTDSEIPDTIVRTSTLPEELGRIEYLLTDKTGTLTQNEMEMKRLHLGTVSFAIDTMDEVALQLAIAFGVSPKGDKGSRVGRLLTGSAMASRGRRDMSARVKDVALALGLCHNVTPVNNDDGSVTYQASSPDEVAIVQFTESVGLTLASRDRTFMELQTPAGSKIGFDILDVFPFTSESKRMSLVVRDRENGEIMFYEKGADVVMADIVQSNDWLEEECGNMAREGLRTLVIGRKRLTEELWDTFKQRYHEARVSLEDRNEAMARVVAEYLETNLELLGVTGVEDKLQDDVKLTLELLRNAGLRCWILTGDKMETATCIAISSKLVSRGQYIHQVAKLRTQQEAQDELDFLQTKLDCCLVIDGESLHLCLEYFRNEFIELATKLPCVVACRCSPTQKADIARLIREYTGKRVCCIGDGGNDVSMIQAANVGIGIVGKEGKQASLAADFSITQFSYLSKLLCWHGRNSYKRSCKLASFIIHRGLIISVQQAVFSAVFYFSPIAIYQGWLMVGYATIYTMFPAFSFVLDRDINEDLALLYPELYKDLTKGRSLSYKTFFTWVLISVYQGGAIMLLSLILFEDDFINIVAISFTALVLNEICLIAVEITTWHLYMVLAEIGSLALYLISIPALPQFFDLSFVLSTRFVSKVALIVAVSAAPVFIIKYLKSRLAPATYAKISAYD